MSELSQAFKNSFDLAYLHIESEVRREVTQLVKDYLHKEFDKLIQDSVDKALSDVIFTMYHTKDPIERATHLNVVVEWIKAKPGKRRLKEVCQVVMEEAD